jgi:hypothetical protein
MREVRQRCGFGCAICGFPIYEYDHLLGWANVKRHIASEITLLCDTHHRLKTAGFLPDAKIIAADRDPFNRRTGVTKPYELYYSGHEFSIAIGTVSFQGIDAGGGTIGEAVRIDGEPLLWVRLEDGHFLLNLNVYNSSGGIALQISDNELVANVHSWDIELVGTRLIIREANRNILFDILFRPPSRVVIKRGKFLRNGIELFITPEWCALLNNMMLYQNVSIVNCHAGLVIGSDPDAPSAAFRIDGIMREGWDRGAAIRWARETAAASAQVRVVLDELLAARTPS